jgi:hypothetical protein
MSVILQGRLGSFPPEQILTFLSQYRHSGALDLTSGQTQARVFFQMGNVVHAERDGESSVDEILCDLFVWPAGTFTFSPDVPLPEGTAVASVDLPAIIRRGNERASDWRRLLQFFPNEEIVLRVIAAPVVKGSINLSSDEFRVLMKIGAGRKLGELRTDMNWPAADLYSLVHRLEDTGLLMRDAAPPADEILTIREFDIQPQYFISNGRNDQSP